MKGRVKFWNTQKGFGFIEPDDGSEDVFAHIFQMQDGLDAPTPDSVVSFELIFAADGRRQANDIMVIERSQPSTPATTTGRTPSTLQEPASSRKRESLWPSARRTVLADETANTLLAIAKGEVETSGDILDQRVEAARLIFDALNKDATLG